MLNKSFSNNCIRFVDLSLKDTIVARVTIQQYRHVKAQAENQNCSEAEIIRKYIQQNMEENHVFLPLSKGERCFLEEVAEKLQISIDDAIRSIIFSYKTLMEAPLWKVIKPISEIMEEVETAKSGS